MSQASAKAAAITDIYRQVDAPGYAAANLDALLDVLRDLSWLPHGPVAVELPDLSRLSESDRRALLGVLASAADDAIDSDRPLRIDRTVT